MAGGRPPKEKSFANMLRIAISEAVLDEETGESKPKLRAVAEMLVTKALEGDMAAIREVADRLDGKPAQAVEVTTPDAPSRLTDAELELIATASSIGATETPPSKNKLN